MEGMRLLWCNIFRSRYIVSGLVAIIYLLLGTSSFPPVLAQSGELESALYSPEGANCSSPVEFDNQWSNGYRLVCQNNLYVLMVDLTNPAVKVEVAGLGPNSIQSVSSFADSNTIAMINADYQWCASPNCGPQSLVISNGSNPTTHTNISHLCSDARVRREIGFSQDGRPVMDWWYRFVSDSQARSWCGDIPGSGGGLEQYSYNLVGGGPQFTFDGSFRWDCQYGQDANHNCRDSNGNGTGDVGINGEHFGYGNWWNRYQSAIGYSTDGQVLVLAESNNRTHTMQEVHDIMYQRLDVYGKTLKNAFKFDGGSKAGFWYYNSTYDSTSGVTVPNVIRIQRTNSNCYSLSTGVNPGGAGTVSVNTPSNCAQGKYLPGTNVQVTSSANSGYTFSNWSGDASGSTNPTTITMNGNKNVTANFSQPCYSLGLTVNPGGAGTITTNPSPNCGAQYTAGTNVEVTGHANSGYSFSSWTGDINGLSNPTTVTMTADRNVTANFDTTPTGPPVTPTNFRVSGTSINTVTLAWDNVERETGYKIYKWGYDDTLGDWTFIYLASVGTDATTYTDDGLFCQIDYYYEVSAYNDYGESQHHPWVLGRTQDCPAVANDEIANAVVVSGNSYATSQDSTIATTASNDPVLPCGSVSTGSASVWYRFTPNSTGLLEVNTNGSNYDTMLAVWRGNAGNLTNIACDDDNGEGLASLVSRVYLYKGVTYFLEVTRYTSGLVPVDKPAQAKDDVRMPHALPSGAEKNGQAEAGGGTLNLALTFSPTVQRLNKMVDFDGDGKSDIGLFRPGTRVWYLRNSSTNQTTGAAVQWGLANDVPFTGEFDGDGRTDLGIYRPSNTTWYILKSTANYGGWFAVKYGVATDVPMLGDYDGDGKTDIALFRPSTRVWYVMRSSTNYASGFALQWGVTNDKPVTGDFDGDGRNDIGVFRPGNGTWYILRSSLNYTSPLAIKYGVGTDTLVPGDYDGDGRTDIALFRESTRVWYVLRSSSNYTTSFAQQWGLSGDKAVAGDFDGDGRTDMVLFRASNTTWYPRLSSSEYGTYWAVRYGASSDLTLPR